MRTSSREQLQLLHALQISATVACSPGHAALHLASFERAAASSPALLLWRKPSLQYGREARKRGWRHRESSREHGLERGEAPSSRPGPKPWVLSSGQSLGDVKVLVSRTLSNRESCPRTGDYYQASNAQSLWGSLRKTPVS